MTGGHPGMNTRSQVEEKLCVLPDGVHELCIFSVETEASISVDADGPHRPVADLTGCRVTLVVVVCHERKKSSRLALRVQQWSQWHVSAVELPQPQPRHRAQHHDRQEACVVLAAAQVAHSELARHDDCVAATSVGHIVRISITADHLVMDTGLKGTRVPVKR